MSLIDSVASKGLLRGQKFKIVNLREILCINNAVIFNSLRISIFFCLLGSAFADSSTMFVVSIT
jgi:hypothetical protein